MVSNNVSNDSGDTNEKENVVSTLLGGHLLNDRSYFYPIFFSLNQNKHLFTYTNFVKSFKGEKNSWNHDFSFETGNLGRVDFITENEYDLFVRPDTCNPRVRFWFYFSVENTQLDQRGMK